MLGSGSNGTIQYDILGRTMPACLGETGQPMSVQEKRLRHCLNQRTCRWCQAEFAVSAIDRPFWAAGGMPEVLQSLGLASVRAERA